MYIVDKQLNLSPIKFGMHSLFVFVHSSQVLLVRVASDLFRCSWFRFYLYRWYNRGRLRLRGVSADTRTAVILRIEAEGVGVGLGHAEGLVPVAGRVVADVDLVVVDAAGVVLDDAEVVVRVVGVGVADLVLELLDAALLGLAFSDDLGEVAADVGGCFLGDGFFVVGARVDAGKLEGVLNGLADFAGVATLGDFGVVAHVEEGVGDLAVGDPDVDDRDLGVLHALGHEGAFHDRFDVVLAETLGLSERSGVVLSEYAGEGAGKGVLHSETDMGGVLMVDLDRDIGIESFSLVAHEDGIRQRTRP